MSGGSRKAVIMALLANLGIAMSKLVGFMVTGSASMLAESLHSVADSGNQALLLLGHARARRQPTAEHPFGYGREGYFWGFVVAMVLFSLGSLFSLAEGVGKLRHPHTVESLGWAIGILVVAIALECLSLRTAVREANRTRSGTGWWSFVRRSKTAELPVVLLEDTAALLGLGLALAGVTLAAATGVPRFDAAGSLAIGVLLATIAAVLGVEMKSLLIGEAASASMSESIRRAIQSSDGVRRIIHLRTLHLGPDELLVAAKVELDHDLTFDTVVDVINTTEDCIRDRVPSARVIYLKPDRVDARRPAGGGGNEPA